MPLTNFFKSSALLLGSLSDGAGAGVAVGKWDDAGATTGSAKGTGVAVGPSGCPVSRKDEGVGVWVFWGTAGSGFDLAESGAAPGAGSVAGGGVASVAALALLTAEEAGAPDADGAMMAGLEGGAEGVGSGSVPHPTHRNAANTVKLTYNPVFPHITTREPLVSVGYENHFMSNGTRKVYHTVKLRKHCLI